MTGVAQVWGLPPLARPKSQHNTRDDNGSNQRCNCYFPITGIPLSNPADALPLSPGDQSGRQHFVPKANLTETPDDAVLLRGYTE
jgi:hypothetical protein